MEGRSAARQRTGRTVLPEKKCSTFDFSGKAYPGGARLSPPNPKGRREPIDQKGGRGWGRNRGNTTKKKGTLAFGQRREKK